LTLALIDIGSGNLHSVENALRAAGCEDLLVTADPDAVARADRIVLPGVGAFGACAASLRAVPGLEEALADAALTRARPFLGVCVGMQLLADTGEEHGVHRGLGWLRARVRRLAPKGRARVPHMGWNDVRPVTTHALVLAGEAYFLHSYAWDGAGVVAETDHGGPVPAAVAQGTVLGVQFHPEKSQRYGIAMLGKFLAWRP
jgi:imidazole glycerol-phosphate synthase subunit HisH